MADEKQLTVAELLARNKKDRTDDSEKTSRRRRRSVEEGGVSVAELTGSLKKVKSTPPEAKHTNVSIDDGAPVIRVPKSKDEQSAEDKTQRASDSTAKSAGSKAAEAKSAEAKLAASKPAQSEPDDMAGTKATEKTFQQPSADDTAVIQRIDKSPSSKGEPKDVRDADIEGKSAAPGHQPAAAVQKSDDTGELPQVQDEEITEENEKLNPMSILMMVVVGIVLAIIIFKGFEVLWDNFPRIVVAILALCVTAIMVGVTHALRSAHDGFSMFLAGMTGLILTFGPLLLVML
ncbi:tripartite tricarboxylate transporter TctB family protein [Corynebacterium macginleyi]|uniref:tripartite tricarboxylate transporter TctB family protein n=1 Tax=Corynebacterium macginleyi TaxID=38290 RepID=UPI0019091AB1|nr:tripartite tricarboxylate transporter TctB family protein [Corynebacterium macginleyi]MBK4137083.1 tripartite tricarboxylate transporter TctB family protein [Corynebacterium macginleyi]